MSSPRSLQLDMSLWDWHVKLPLFDVLLIVLYDKHTWFDFSPSWGPKKKKSLAVQHCENSSAQHRSKLANKSKANPVLPCLILLYHYTYKSLISRGLRNLRFSLIKHKTCCVWERMWWSRGRTEKYTRKWTREIFNDYYIWYDRVKVTARCIPPLVHLKEMHLWDMASAHRVVSVPFYLCPVV